MSLGRLPGPRSGGSLGWAGFHCPSTVLQHESGSYRGRSPIPDAGSLGGLRSNPLYVTFSPAFLSFLLYSACLSLISLSLSVYLSYSLSLQMAICLSFLLMSLSVSISPMFSFPEISVSPFSLSKAGPTVSGSHTRLCPPGAHSPPPFEAVFPHSHLQRMLTKDKDSFSSHGFTVSRPHLCGEQLLKTLPPSVSLRPGSRAADTRMLSTSGGSALP